MLKPTLGLDVHFNDIHAGLLAAKITKVWSDTCVNLTVFDNGDGTLGGAIVQRTSIVLGTAPDTFQFMPETETEKPKAAKPAAVPAAVPAPVAPTPAPIVAEVPAPAATTASLGDIINTPAATEPKA